MPGNPYGKGLTCRHCGRRRINRSRAYCAKCYHEAQKCNSFDLGFKCDTCGGLRSDCSQRFCGPRCSHRFHNTVIAQIKRRKRAALISAQRLETTAWAIDANGVMTRTKFTEARTS